MKNKIKQFIRSKFYVSADLSSINVYDVPLRKIVIETVLPKFRLECQEDYGSSKFTFTIKFVPTGAFDFLYNLLGGKSETSS